MNGSLAPVNGSTVPITPFEFYVGAETGPQFNEYVNIESVADETTPLALGSHVFTVTATLAGGTVVAGNNTRTFVVSADPTSLGVAYGTGAIAGATLRALRVKPDLLRCHGHHH